MGAFMAACCVGEEDEEAWSGIGLGRTGGGTTCHARTVHVLAAHFSGGLDQLCDQPGWSQTRLKYFRIRVHF
jgi:hypothetical protein